MLAAEYIHAQAEHNRWLGQQQGRRWGRQGLPAGGTLAVRHREAGVGVAVGALDLAEGSYGVAVHRPVMLLHLVHLMRQQHVVAEVERLVRHIEGQKLVLHIHC